MRAALKVMAPVLLFWPTVSEVDVGMAVQVESSLQYSATRCCHITDGSIGAASDMELLVKQRCGIELLHEKNLHSLPFVDAC